MWNVSANERQVWNVSANERQVWNVLANERHQWDTIGLPDVGDIADVGKDPDEEAGEPPEQGAHARKQQKVYRSIL